MRWIIILGPPHWDLHGTCELLKKREVILRRVIPNARAAYVPSIARQLSKTYKNIVSIFIYILILHSNKNHVLQCPFTLISETVISIPMKLHECTYTIGGSSKYLPLAILYDKITSCVVFRLYANNLLALVCHFSIFITLCSSPKGQFINHLIFSFFKF